KSNHSKSSFMPRRRIKRRLDVSQRPSRKMPSTSTEESMTPTLQATATVERETREHLGRAMEIAGPVLESVEARLEEVVASLDPRVGPVVAHLTAAGGKRVRPLLVALAGAAFGAGTDDLAELGAAAELVHTATLLHDDVVDRGEERRGRVSANAAFGNGPAVLSGDFL